jgi:hypothetical protein
VPGAAGAYPQPNHVAIARASLARISHQLSAATRDKAMSASLRLLTVLDVLFKYACAR